MDDDDAFFMNMCGLNSNSDTFVWKAYYERTKAAMGIYREAMGVLDAFGAELVFDFVSMSPDQFKSLICAAMYIPCNANCTIIIPSDNLLTRNMDETAIKAFCRGFFEI